jgi:hypothetical protein
MSSHSRRREVAKLIKSVKLLDEHLLDQAISEQKQLETDTINRGGVGRQVNWLVEHLGYPATEQLIDSCIRDDQAAGDIAAAFVDKAREEALAHAVYAQKQAEADVLTSEKPFAQVKHLVTRLGKETVLRILTAH